MKRRALVIIAASCMTAAVAAAALAWSQPSPITDAEPSPLPAPPPAESGPGPLQDAAQNLTDMLRSSYPSNFAGIAVREETITVYRIPDDGLDRAARQALSNEIDLRLSDALFSLIDMESLASRLDRDRAMWADSGIIINRISILPDGSGIEVGVTRDAASAQQRFRARYDTAAVRAVAEAPPIPLRARVRPTLPTTTTR